MTKLSEIEARAERPTQLPQRVAQWVAAMMESCQDVPALCATVRELARDNARLRRAALDVSGWMVHLMPTSNDARELRGNLIAALNARPALPVEVDGE